jgi:hypothetical protein
MWHLTNGARCPVAGAGTELHCSTQSEVSMRIQNLLPFGALFASTALFACGSNSGGSGPSSSVGGSSSHSSSSTSTSSNSTGGSASVGGSGQSSTTSNNTSSGGNTAVGGTSAGQGGTSSSATTGTKATGGTSTSATGGKSNAGGTSGSTGGTKATGGNATVGGTSATNGGTSSTGTKATGGNATVGGTSATNGGTSAAAGSTSTAGAGGGGARPKGYYYLSDWNVTTADWHGCVWSGIDSTVSGSTTTITTPASKDFMSVADGGPYELAGSVYKSYDAVAMIGFNLNEAIDGTTDQCKYNAAAATADGPPAATIPSSATGIAVNWSVTKAPPTSFRIQIQGVDGASNADHRWCATITDTAGPSFVKFTDFYTKCWFVDSTTDSPGNQYKGEAIDAVVFLVPGTEANLAPFDFTIGGFAPGTSKADAPGPAAECGKTSGTLGSTTASAAASMQRAKITGADCKEYIVFNNNWSNQTGSTQLISFTGNKFTVTQGSSANGNGAPASFPSIYIGGNGDTANGTYSTLANSGLPKKVSEITSVTTTFTWTGNTGDYNAAYDIWFSDKSTSVAYNDAIAGFLMVWLYKPSNQQPIGGSSKRSTGTIAGHKWDVWVGPRGNTSDGTNDANRPVISYVAQDGPIKSLTFNIKDFMADAVTNADKDKQNGLTSAAFSSGWYLTDVFAGFEAWTGSSITGNTAQMSCVIQ